MIPEDQLENQKVSEVEEPKTEEAQEVEEVLTENTVGEASRLDNPAPKKNNKNKLILLVAAVLIVLVGGFGYQQMKSNSEAKKAEAEQVKKDKEVESGKETREAMTSVSDLYVNISKNELRTDIKDSELKKAKDSISKLEDGKLKDGLTKQLKDVEKEVKSAEKK